MDDELAEKPIFILEDEFYIAAKLERALQDRQVKVVDPASRLPATLALTRAAPLHALLDINLHNQPVFPIAPALSEREVPFIFITGYDDLVIPEEYRNIPRMTKTFDTGKLIDAVGDLLRTEGSS